MSDGEKAPLLGSDSFKEAGGARYGGSLCGPCGGRCNRVVTLPLTACRRKASDKDTFSSSLAMLLTCLGSVVGTGNIWRFPRILATNSDEGGALSFLLVWFSFLWLWSIPLVLIEYGVGRYTRKTLVESFASLLGPSYRFMGAFPVVVSFCIGSYYSVLVGWCGYYFIYTCAQPLPSNQDASQEIWNSLQDSQWPVVCHAVAIVLTSLSVSRGVSTIEPVNKVIVPVLLSIVVLCFYWSIFLPHASTGITHLFSPSWKSLQDSNLWISAASQNAWDTSAGLGLFLTYATFMKRSQGAVKLGLLTPVLNNAVSLMCGITVYSTVFSVLMTDDTTLPDIVDTLKTNGEANTGLTFIWMPVLFRSIGAGGRFLAIAFFLCLFLSGLSSLIALLELPIHTLTDFGVKRIPATVLVGGAAFLAGYASAVNLSILVNQDAVWGYALLLCGCFLLFLVLRFGVLRFRKQLFNNYGIGDWPLPWVWVVIVVFVAPLEGAGLIVWWAVDSVRYHLGTWWQLSTESLAMTLTQWALVLLVVVGFNWVLKPLVVRPPSSPFWRRVVGAFIIFPNERDSPSHQPQLEISGNDATRLTLQSVRKDINSPDTIDIDRHDIDTESDAIDTEQLSSSAAIKIEEVQL